MAAVSDLKISRELRPCLIVSHKEGVKPVKALFHMWEQYSDVIGESPLIGGHKGGTISNVAGIVELEDGRVMRVPPYQIQFVDNKIQEYAFNGSEAEEGDI